MGLSIHHQSKIYKNNIYFVLTDEKKKYELVDSLMNVIFPLSCVISVHWLHPMFFYVCGMVFHMNKIIRQPRYVSELFLSNPQSQGSRWLYEMLGISFAVLIDILTFQIEIQRTEWIFVGWLNPLIALFHLEMPFGLAECFQPHLSNLSWQNHLLYLMSTSDGQAALFRLSTENWVILFATKKLNILYARQFNYPKLVQ